MRLRSFTARDMPSALEMVRAALGDDAIILSSQETPGGRGITVTAAIDESEEDGGFAPPLPRARPKSQQTVLQPQAPSEFTNLRLELQNILRFHNIPEMFIARMMQHATDSLLSASVGLHRMGGAKHDHDVLLQGVLEKILAAHFEFQPLSFHMPLRLMLIGTPGIGKTLTVAKLAARLAVEKRPLLVITTDNKRAGGIEQLKAFTDILGLELHTADSRASLWRLLQNAPTQGHVLIDTAGCNPYAAAEMSELVAYASLEGIEPVLTLPAGGDSLEAIDMAEAFADAPVARILPTRVDTTRRFGGLLAAAAAKRLPFCNASGSSRIIDALQPVDAGLLAQFLLKHKVNQE